MNCNRLLLRWNFTGNKTTNYRSYTMKKLILIIIFTLTTLLFCAGLSKEATFIKKEMTKYYTQIKTDAVTKWSDNPKMAIYEINRQCKAFIEFAETTKEPDYHNLTLLKAMAKWGYNYKMVMYEYRRQNKARLELEGM